MDWSEQEQSSYDAYVIRECIVFLWFVHGFEESSGSWTRDCPGDSEESKRRQTAHGSIHPKTAFLSTATWYFVQSCCEHYVWSKINKFAWKRCRYSPNGLRIGYILIIKRLGTITQPLGKYMLLVLVDSYCVGTPRQDVRTRRTAGKYDAKLWCNCQRKNVNGITGWLSSRYVVMVDGDDRWRSCRVVEGGTVPVI